MFFNMFIQWTIKCFPSNEMLKVSNVSGNPSDKLDYITRFMSLFHLQYRVWTYFTQTQKLCEICHVIFFNASHKPNSYSCLFTVRETQHHLFSVWKSSTSMAFPSLAPMYSYTGPFFADAKWNLSQQSVRSVRCRNGCCWYRDSLQLRRTFWST